MFQPPKPQRTQYSTRTFNSMEMDGLNRPTTTNMANHFLKCRFDPFGGVPANVKIPDGRGKNLVVRDYKTQYDIVMSGTDSMEIRIGPYFPYPVRFSPMGAGAPNAFINGVNIGNASTGPSPVSTVSGIVLDTPMSTLFVNVGGTSAEAANTISARILSIGYRLYYSGPIASASGIINVDNLPISKEQQAVMTTTLTQVNYGATSPAPTTLGIGNFIQYLDVTPFGFTNLTTDQVQLRPEQGLNGVLKMNKNTTDHVFCPWFDYGTVIGALPTTSSTVPQLFYDGLTTSATPAKGYGAFFVDDAFMEVNIRLPSLQANSFRLEISLCMEQELALTSNMIDMARPSPLMDRALLAIDDALNSRLIPAPFGSPTMTNVSGITGGMQRMRPFSKRQPRQRKAKPAKSAKTARRKRYRQRRSARLRAIRNGRA